MVFYYLNSKTVPYLDKDTTILKAINFNSYLVEYGA